MDLLSGDSGHSEVESKLDKHDSRVQLFDILSDSTPFSLEELKRLVRYELGVEPETFTSNNVNKLTFADNLIGYCRRNGYLTALLSAMRRAKPNEARIEALSLEVGLPEQPLASDGAARKTAPILAGGRSGPVPASLSPAAPNLGEADGADGAGAVWRSPTVIAAVIGLVGTLGAVFLTFWLNRDAGPEQPLTPIAAVTEDTPTAAPPYPEPATETPTPPPPPTDTLTPRPPTETLTLTPSPTDRPSDTPTNLPPTDTLTPRPPTETPTSPPPTMTPTASVTVNPVVTHRVQAREHLSCISQNYYGTNTVSVILCAFNQERGVIGDGADNPDIDPCSRIRSGQILHIPYFPTRVVPEITLPPHVPNACPATPTVTVIVSATPTPRLSSTPMPTATSTSLPTPSATQTLLPTTPAPAESEPLTATPTATDAADNAGSQQSSGGTPVDSSTFHIVQPEDNLSCIANFYYGNEALFVGLCDANREFIDQCPDIQIGMTLIIPDNLLGFDLLPIESRVDRCETGEP